MVPGHHAKHAATSVRTYDAKIDSPQEFDSLLLLIMSTDAVLHFEDIEMGVAECSAFIKCLGA